MIFGTLDHTEKSLSRNLNQLRDFILIHLLKAILF